MPAAQPMPGEPGWVPGTPISVARPFLDPSVVSDDYVRHYMTYFGYARNEDGVHVDDPNDEELEAAIKEFQDQHNLTVDGVVGPETAHIMFLPRCGVPEFNVAGQELWRWTNPECTYYFDPGFTDAFKLPKDKLELLLKKIFEYNWCQHTNLNFRRSMQEGANINVYAGKIDGPSRILGQTQLPVDGVSPCRMDLDYSENWGLTINPAAQVVCLEGTITHELGHGIGMPHSKLKTALMAPIYTDAIQVPTAEDDIPRTQVRYGGSRTWPLLWTPGMGTPTNPNIPTPPPAGQPDLKFQKITIRVNDQDHVFNVN